MVAGQRLPVAQLPSVSSAVLAAVAVAGEEEGIGDLPPEAAGHVDEAHEADDHGGGETFTLGPVRTGLVDLEGLRLPVDDQPQRPANRQNGQRLERGVESETSHVVRDLLSWSR